MCHWKERLDSLRFESLRGRDLCVMDSEPPWSWTHPWDSLGKQKAEAVRTCF